MTTDTIHLSGYQARDYDVVDYQMYQDAHSGLWFRGPQPKLVPGEYISCLGAAQIFGCFCQETIPDMLSEALGIEAVNYGYGGAGPAFFAGQERLLETVNKGKLAVIQIMSGRSENNDLFEGGGLEYLTRRTTGEKLSADDAYSSLLAEYAPSLPHPLGRAVRLFHAPGEVRRIVEQTRSNWIASYHSLLEQIKVPVVFLWISKRPPWLYRSEKASWFWQRYDHTQAMFGDFPQMVNARMVKAIQLPGTLYVESVSKRGSPQPLFSRFTGEPIVVDMSKDRPDFKEQATHNLYYPSPEMLEDAAEALMPTLKQLLDSSERA